jgi:glutaredoxin 3
MNVTIYSTPTCAFCHMAKEYFKANNVTFSDKDVSTDPKAYKEVIDKMDGRFAGVPVIDIDGTIVLGFDRPKIDIALKDKGLV